MYLLKEKGIELILRVQLIYNLFFVGILMGFPTKDVYAIYAFVNVIIAIYLLKYIKIFKNNIPWYASLSYITLFFYTIYVCINLNGDYSIRTLLRFSYHPQYFMCYLAPFILFRLSNIQDLQIVLRFVYKQSLMYFVLLIICFIYCSYNSDLRFRDCLEILQTYIGGGVIILPFFFERFNRKEKVYISFVLFLTILLSAIFARRAILLISILSIGLGYFVGIINKKNIGGKMFAIAKIILFITIVLIVGIETISSYFPTLTERMMDDTRSGVELEVLYYLENKGKIMTGAGFNSVFYSDYVDEVRDNVETGYLSQMLRGGIVYIILFALFTLPAIFITIFKKQKRNLLPLAAYSLLFIIAYNVASNSFSFSIRYILFLYGIACMYKNFNNKKISRYEV